MQHEGGQCAVWTRPCLSHCIPVSGDARSPSARWQTEAVTTVWFFGRTPHRHTHRCLWPQFSLQPCCLTQLSVGGEPGCRSSGVSGLVPKERMGSNQTLKVCGPGPGRPGRCQGQKCGRSGSSHETFLFFTRVSPRFCPVAPSLKWRGFSAWWQPHF